ncbi:nucleotidyl transferase AbiEii/AbiGii toxin family protein [Spiribacter sp. 218]|uniref:nucleotidyl transferase AbiEii/AbiGii toxin family protein n=1 Tax=Spiribacter pallidus TaxID=1987936 RepID=UPI00349FA19F
MIPSQNIIAWSRIVPWTDWRQVEQDLIISRALVAVFADSELRDQLRFRGGTALNKLHFDPPLRYSEDIDLVRTTAGPIGPILDRLRAVLEPWLGRGQFDGSSPVAPKLFFKVEGERDSDRPIRLKLEINTRERVAFDPPIEMPFSVENPWFTDSADIVTFSIEELLATKMRALLQRNKGRDLFDLSYALNVFEQLDVDHTVELFGKYLEVSGQTISQAQAHERMFAKLANPNFLADIRPLLSAEQAALLNERSIKEAFANVFSRLTCRIPGDPWQRCDEMKQRFGIE